MLVAAGFAVEDGYDGGVKVTPAAASVGLAGESRGESSVELAREQVAEAAEADSGAVTEAERAEDGVIEADSEGITEAGRQRGRKMVL